MSTKTVYNSTDPSLEDGQYTDLQATIDGLLKVADGTLADSIGDPTDAAWDGVAASATVIALLKKIALNTAPAA